MNKKTGSAQPDYAFIECPYCRARVQAMVLAKRMYYPDEHTPEPYAYAFVQCTSCHTMMVGYDPCEPQLQDEGPVLLAREWPDPDQQYPLNLPVNVRSSLTEARKSLAAGAHHAAAVMCGRAVEGICKDKTKSKMLAAGLKKMKEMKIIDSKLYDWGEALRRERNIGAHAGEDTISSRDAKDVYDFAVAIAEYVYVLDEKYRKYTFRKKMRAKKKISKK